MIITKYKGDPSSILTSRLCTDTSLPLHLPKPPGQRQQQEQPPPRHVRGGGRGAAGRRKATRDTLMVGANDQGGGERSRREPAVASHRISSSFQAEPAHQGKRHPGPVASASHANGQRAHPSWTMDQAGPTIAERAVSRRHLGEHPMSPRHGRPRALRHTPTARGPGRRHRYC